MEKFIVYFTINFDTLWKYNSWYRYVNKYAVIKLIIRKMLNLQTIRCWHISQMATTAGNFTMTSVKFNTFAVYRGTYHSILLNTVVYHHRVLGDAGFCVPGRINPGPDS